MSTKEILLLLWIVIFKGSYGDFMSLSKTKRIQKLRKREAKRIEELNKFWDEHKHPTLDLILPEYITQYYKMRNGLIDLQKAIAELEYGIKV